MKNKKYIWLDGILEIDKSFTEEKVIDLFIQWVESQGFSYGGSVCEVDNEGQPIDKRERPIQGIV